MEKELQIYGKMKAGGKRKKVILLVYQNFGLIAISPKTLVI